MEVDEQIKVFREFIEQSYYPQLLEAVRKGNNFLVLDFSELIKFNTEISEELLETPEELLKAAELAVRDFDLPKKITKFNIRIRNLAESQKIAISNIRSKHLGKFIAVEGIVRQKSDVRPHVTAAKFECPSCGNTMLILQLDQQFKEPSRCSCGRKGFFKLISKQMADAQRLVVEESPEALIGGEQPRRMNIFLKELVIFGNDASKQQLIGIATYSIGFYKGSIELAKNKGIKIEEAMNIEIKKTRDFLCDIDKHYYEHLKGKTAHPMKELVSWMQSQEEN